MVSSQLISELLYLQAARCPICKEKVIGKKFIMHHLDQDRENNKIINLMVLCQSCHRILHTQNKLKINKTHAELERAKQKIKEYEKKFAEIRKEIKSALKDSDDFHKKPSLCPRCTKTIIWNINEDGEEWKHSCPECNYSFGRRKTETDETELFHDPLVLAKGVN